MSDAPLIRADFRLPSRAGVGLKAEHYRTILETKPAIGFFEVHAENYMGSGGPPHRFLSAIRETYALSVHGVGLSIGGARPLDVAHLRRLRVVVDRYAPAAVSEHLAWSAHQHGFLDDLLPIPYNNESLERVIAHVEQTQDAIGRQLLLENPSTYLAFEESTIAEPDFIASVVRRSGCGLLLDLNNLYVSAINQQWDPCTWLDAYPLDAVQEIHLAGHARETDDAGRPLLIDTHDRQVDDFVWGLYRRTIRRTGPLPTAIEWDANVPDWPTLAAQATLADAVMQASSRCTSARPAPSLAAPPRHTPAATT